ncbi:MAG: alpha/beta fold hydrolase [Actinomycetota bacterium]|nr:alpha/beta fold hydrolase [Actinomycetota bacterium]
MGVGQSDLSFEATSRVATIDGRTLHYNEAGEGPVVVALHGGGPGASGYDNYHLNLPTLTKHFRVLCVDLPGYGLSDAILDGNHYANSATAIIGLLDDLGIEKAHYLGNSMGGGVSLRTALDFPDRVDRMVQIAPGGANVSLFSADPTEGARIMRAFYDEPGPSREKMAAFLRVLIHDPTVVTDELIDARYEAAIKQGKQGAMNYAIGTVQQRSTPKHEDPARQLWKYLEQIPHPTLLVWGRDDRITPVGAAFLPLKRLQNASLHIFGGCGHSVQIDRVDDFNALVIEFFQRKSVRA